MNAEIVGAIVFLRGEITRLRVDLVTAGSPATLEQEKVRDSRVRENNAAVAAIDALESYLDHSEGRTR